MGWAVAWCERCFLWMGTESWGEESRKRGKLDPVGRELEGGQNFSQRGEMHLFSLPHRTCSAAIFSSSPGPATGLCGQRQVGRQVLEERQTGNGRGKATKPWGTDNCKSWQGPGRLFQFRQMQLSPGHLLMSQRSETLSIRGWTLPPGFTNAILYCPPFPGHQMPPYGH